MDNRVVITGLGIVSPNGIGVSDFLSALKAGRSGIQFCPELRDLKFSCQLGGIPPIQEQMRLDHLTKAEQRHMNSSGILYGIMAGLEAMKDGNLALRDNQSSPNWDLGVVFGTGTSGVDKFREAIYKLDQGEVRRLGSTTVAQTMASGISAYLSGRTGAANWVTTNSSACATGTESMLMGFQRIRSGQAKQMLCGSCSDHGPYVWGGFDAMRVTTYKHNDDPQRGSRPMSASASGFVPSSGAGAVLLESLESAQQRGAHIYAEMLGGAVNSGGQRQGGTMTAPNPEAIRRCIKKALEQANVKPEEIDYINGHLTATVKDPEEIANWSSALGRAGKDFPWINSLKSMIGHGLAASGSMEIVATLLQLHHNFIAPNLNCVDLHPDIAQLISPERIPLSTLEVPLTTAIKASFGFGDVNAVTIFRKNSY